MQPVTKSCQWPLQLFEQLIWRVPSCFRSGSSWPARASQSLAQRFRRGLRLVEAFLRRVLLVLALEMEPGLADRSVAVRCRRARTRKWRPLVPRFVVLNERFMPDMDRRMQELAEQRPARRP
jgi:hypothetical protein